MNSRIAILTTVLISTGAVPGAAHAAKWWLYAVPFTCGEAIDGDTAAVPGVYASAVTVTNLDHRDTLIRAQAKLTVPSRAKSDLVRRQLAGLSATTVDCENLADLFDPGPGVDLAAYRQGILLLESPFLLRVQVQTTVTNDIGGPSISQQSVDGQVVPRPRDWHRADPASVTICHVPPGNPSAAHTITVSPSAVSAHERHGDYRGECVD